MGVPITVPAEGMGAGLADPYVASRETPSREPHRRADLADLADRQSSLNGLASGAWTRWPG
ncbi:hypothetical protein [Streptomyces phaeochromogenes]